MYYLCLIFISTHICLSFGLYEKANVYNLPDECANFTGNISERMILDKYFKPYNARYRPTFNANRPLPIEVQFAVRSIVELYERQQIMDVEGQFYLKWMDEYRKWNDSFPFNCVKYVVLPAEQVWLPDLILANARNRYTITRLKYERVRVYSNGYITYSPGGSFSVYCHFDLSMFPFDVQVSTKKTCPVIVEAWKYSSAYMSIVAIKHVKLIHYKGHEQWTLIDTFVKDIPTSYSVYNISFDRVGHYLVLKRKTMYYTANAILPSMLLAITHLSTFMLPLAERAKISNSFTCILAYFVFKLMIVEHLPRSSDNIPILSIFIDLMMYYIAFSVLGEGLCFMALGRINREGNTSKVPRALRQLFGSIGRMCFVDVNSKIIVDQSRANISENEKNIRHWQFLATVISRIVAVGYILCITLTPFITFILIPTIRLQQD